MAGSGDDVLVGTNRANMLYGSGGHDWIAGRGGDDEIYGGPGMDTILGEWGADRLFGDEGGDVLRGGRVRTGSRVMTTFRVKAIACTATPATTLLAAEGAALIDCGPGRDGVSTDLLTAPLAIVTRRCELYGVRQKSARSQTRTGNRCTSPSSVITSHTGLSPRLRERLIGEKSSGACDTPGGLDLAVRRGFASPSTQAGSATSGHGPGDRGRFRDRATGIQRPAPRAVDSSASRQRLAGLKVRPHRPACVSELSGPDAPSRARARNHPHARLASAWLESEGEAAWRTVAFACQEHSRRRDNECCNARQGAVPRLTAARDPARPCRASRA